ncbi:MAG: hypothetical protein E6K81_14250 [Candidatus Eisenbacteria bacterium]|uniref:Uncharacterized protein n=1 Tax=Eiseniibacteriota bacterium TaxID=2212470 RepID=A0A538U1H8_UNCEI|nr:MAG: hypothetical protein E6K81_14250 [Candidatus Eisenbacteria bacterium]
MARFAWVAALVGVVIAFGLSRPATTAPSEGGKKLDTFWTSPAMDSLALRSVTLLPGASFDNELTTEKELETAWAPVSKATGYRWYYSTLAKDLLRHAFGGDSVLKAIRAGLLKDGRVDSVSAQRLCAALHTSAILTLRADVWERTQIEWNQTGKPWTRVAVKAALVDSTGRLLWTASGNETMEGPLHQADDATLGVKSSGLNLQSVTGEAGAPAFQEVLAKLFTRWAANFPGRPAPAAAPAPASGGGS